MLLKQARIVKRHGPRAFAVIFDDAPAICMVECIGIDCFPSRREFATNAATGGGPSGLKAMMIRLRQDFDARVQGLPLNKVNGDISQTYRDEAAVLGPQDDELSSVSVTLEMSGYDMARASYPSCVLYYPAFDVADKGEVDHRVNHA